MGHILAVIQPVGSRLILSLDCISLKKLANIVRQFYPTARLPKALPNWLAFGIAYIGEQLSKLSHTAPLLPKGQLDFFLQSHVMPNSQKAYHVFGWKPMSIKSAIGDALAGLLGQSSKD